MDLRPKHTLGLFSQIIPFLVLRSKTSYELRGDKVMGLIIVQYTISYRYIQVMMIRGQLTSEC